MKLTVVRAPRPLVGGSAEQVTYDVPDMDGYSVSHALQYINRHYDGTLGYYLSCRRGLCAACVVRIEGRNVKACVVPFVDGMIVAPIGGARLIRDTVVHLGVDEAYEFDLGNEPERKEGA